MGNATYYLALMIVYFLIVYLTAVRRNGQRVLPWLLLIIVQTASVYFFRPLRLRFLGVSLFAGASLTLVTCATAAVLLVLNFLIILLINRVFAPEDALAEDDFNLDADDITVGDKDGEELEFRLPVNLSKPAWEPIGNDAALTVAERISEEMNTDQLLETVQMRIDAGETEEAIKYLRMVAFFEKDGEAVQKAKAMLAELQKQE